MKLVQARITRDLRRSENPQHVPHGPTICRLRLHFDAPKQSAKKVISSLDCLPPGIIDGTYHGD